MDPEQLQRAAAVLRDAPTVALACHVNPDADALGSMLGLAHHLVARGSQVVCAFPVVVHAAPMGARAARTRVLGAGGRFPSSARRDGDV